MECYINDSIAGKLPINSLVWFEAKSAITLNNNSTVSFDYYGIGVFAVSANSSSGHNSAAYLRDNTTNAYVAAFQGVDAAGGQMSTGFPIMSGRSYTLTYADYTSVIRIWPYRLRISAI